jgi:RNA polymerase sigma-70 factor (ECF subfamily)
VPATHEYPDLPRQKPADPQGSAGGAAALAALGAMFESHSERVYRAAFRITGDAMDAEDVLQTVFLRLARRDQKGSEPLSGDEAVGYFYRSAVNAALDIVRSRQRAGWAPLEDVDGATRQAAGRVTEAGRPGGLGFEPEREHRLTRLRKALRVAISRLSPRSAEIFSLRYFEGLSYQQIAQVTGNSSGLVAVLLHRTRARLKKELSTLGYVAGELS